MNEHVLVRESVGRWGVSQQWLDSLEERVRRAVAYWGLTQVEVLTGGYRGLVATGLWGNKGVVLKIVPSGEGKGQVEAMEVDGGRVYPKLYDVSDHGILMERLRGRTLENVSPADYLNTMAAVMDSLGRLGAGGDRGTWEGWEQECRSSIEAAIKQALGEDKRVAVGRLYNDWKERRVDGRCCDLHGDLHAGHVVIGPRGVRLLDPEPMVGPRGWELEPLLRRFLDANAGIGDMLECLNELGVKRAELVHYALLRQLYYYSLDMDNKWLERAERLSAQR